MSRSVVELDLVMGGSGSAGAYTAGALDFILEAIACLEAARRTEPARFPGPDIRLAPRALSLAGTINDALLATAAAERSHPPLRETWVAGLDPRDGFGMRGSTGRRTNGLRLFDPHALSPLAARLASRVRAVAGRDPAALTVTLVIDPGRDELEDGQRPALGGAAGLLLSGPVETRAHLPDPAPYWIFPRRSHRPGVAHSPALASTVLDGYAGYLDPRFRDHDFRQGRRNAQRTLARYLTLPSTHPLVAEWDESLDRHYGVWPCGIAPLAPAPQRPLIPLTGTAATPCALPDWPKVSERELRKLEPMIARRVERIARDVSDEFLGDSIWRPVARLAIAQRKRTLARQTRLALVETLRATGQIVGTPRGGLRRWFSRRGKPA